MVPCLQPPEFLTLPSPNLIRTLTLLGWQAKSTFVFVPEEIRNEILKRDIKRRRQEFEAGGPSSTHVLLPLTLIPGWPTWQAKRDQMIQAAQMNQVIPHPPIAHTPSVLPPAFEPWIP